MYSCGRGSDHTCDVSTKPGYAVWLQFKMDMYTTACKNAFCHSFSWWRHQMETFSASLALCAGNSPVTGEFPSQRPVTRGFDVFFGLLLNKRLSKQSWGWWFETPSCSLWRHDNIHQRYLKIPESGSRVYPYMCIYHRSDWLLQQFEEWTSRESHRETPACAKHSCQINFQSETVKSHNPCARQALLASGQIPDWIQNTVDRLQKTS